MEQMEPGKIEITDIRMTGRDFDRVVCNWSMVNGVALTEAQLNALVDDLMAARPEAVRSLLAEIK